jgi:hypothetical protein
MLAWKNSGVFIDASVSAQAENRRPIRLHPRLAERRRTQPPDQWRPRAQPTTTRHQQIACGSAVDRPILQGAVHLVLFTTYLFLACLP